MVVPAPTSTKSSKITFPVCGIFLYSPFSSGCKSKTIGSYYSAAMNNTIISYNTFGIYF